MTKQQAEVLFRAWQHRLGLDLWILELRFGPLEDNMAECRRSPNYERAVITISDWLFKKKIVVPDRFLPLTFDDEVIEGAIVHELLHCVVKDYQSIIDDDLDGFLHRDVHRQVSNSMERVNENTIDHLALALVRAWKEK